MKRFNLEILPSAWSELSEIAIYHLHAVGVNSARNITDKIISAMERLK